MNFNYKKLFITAIIVSIASFIISGVTCGWLFNWVYLLEPINVWKPIVYGGNFMATSLAGTFVMMTILVGVYEYIRNGIPLKGIKKGLCLGTMVWLVGILPGMWATYMFNTTNTIVLIYWAIQGLVKYLIIGAIIAWMYELRK